MVVPNLVIVRIYVLAAYGMWRFVEGNDLDLRKTSKIPIKRKKLRSALFTADSDNLSVKDQISPRIGSANRFVKQDRVAGTGIQHSQRRA